MSTPAILYLCVNLFSLGYMATGKPTAVSFGSTFLAWCCITLPLLYWGGFFS